MLIMIVLILQPDSRSFVKMSWKLEGEKSKKRQRMIKKNSLKNYKMILDNMDKNWRKVKFLKTLEKN